MPVFWMCPAPTKLFHCAAAAVVDTTHDVELWALPLGTCVLADPSSNTSLPVVDLIAHPSDMAERVVGPLSRRMWQGRTGDMGEWEAPGQRLSHPPDAPFQAVVLPDDEYCMTHFVRDLAASRSVSGAAAVPALLFLP